MAIDPKKHTTFAPGEVPKRSAAAGLAEAILSISDVVPVANVTERAQVVAALAATTYPVSATRPLTVSRADARGLHRLEHSYDGAVWLPASGVLEFASKAAADAWAASNGALLSVGDRCLAAGVEYVRSATAWVEVVQHQGRAGAAIAGIGIPAAAASATGGLLVKTGQLVVATTVAFGNEYFPVVTFAAPFPNACLGVTVTPLTGSPVTSSAGNPITFDTMNATEFRALVSSSANPWIRAFTWVAFGY